MGSMSSKMMENQKQMMLKQREMMMATEIAKTRDFLQWVGAFTGTYGTIAVIGAARTGSPAIMLPLLPLSFVLAFNYDVAYGNKFERVRLEAEKILREDREAFMVPEGNLLVSPAQYRSIMGLDK